LVIVSVLELLLFSLASFFLGLKLASKREKSPLSNHPKTTLKFQTPEIYPVLEALEEGLILCQKNGDIIYVNPQARIYLDLAKDPLPNLFEILRDLQIENAVREGKKETFEKEFFWPSYRFFSISVLPLEKDLAGLIFQDLTPFKRLLDVRRDFIAHLAHEFRTPLTAIEGYAENLLEEVPKNLRADLEIILKNTKRLSKLLKDLQVLSRLELQGIPEEDFEILDLKEVIYAALEVLFPEASKKDLNLRFVPPAKPVLLRGSFDDLLRALTNLLENAIKFSPPGTEVKVDLYEEGAYWVIQVSDQGPGISDSEKERIFERFYKGKGNGPKGTGLGLAIVKHVAKAHGGKVEVKSTLGKGSIFRLSLPKKENHASLLSQN